jgi:hypothetical protein
MTDATFVFADIAGFTAMTEAHGDEEAVALVKAFTEVATRDLEAIEVAHVRQRPMFRIPKPLAPDRPGLPDGSRSGACPRPVVAPGERLLLLLARMRRSVRATPRALRLRASTPGL